MDEPILHKKIHLTVDELAEIRHMVRDVAQAQGCCQKDIDALVMAANEACANIIQHGYGKEKPGDIILEIFHNHKEMVLRLTDFASPVETSQIHGRDFNELRPGGLGVHFIRELMDRVEYRPTPAEGGNILQLTKKITPSEQQQ